MMPSFRKKRRAKIEIEIVKMKIWNENYLENFFLESYYNTFSDMVYVKLKKLFKNRTMIKNVFT